MSVLIGNKFTVSYYPALAALSQNSNLSSDFDNQSDDSVTEIVPDLIISLPGVKAVFYALYICIFLMGMCGNLLVCHVVFRKKSMQTVTNIFIANLAISDILLCSFAVPFTPMYIFMKEWVFGIVLCHLVPYVQGVSVHISALTLMSIAMERFFVTVYPLKSRLQVQYCYLIIVAVWLASSLLTLPYGLFMNLVTTDAGTYCEEVWPDEETRKAFGFSTLILQFVIPFLIITYCYTRVCIKLKYSAHTKHGSKSLEKERTEKERAQRTNRMLITRVVIFGVSWLPLNVYNLLMDFYIPASTWTFLNIMFFISHASAMSSTCYNPFLYAWLNENFRKEFKTVLPWCGRIRAQLSKEESCSGVVEGSVASRQYGKAESEKLYSGNKFTQEGQVPLKQNLSRKKLLQKDQVTSAKATPLTEAMHLTATNTDEGRVKLMARLPKSITNLPTET